MAVRAETRFRAEVFLCHGSNATDSIAHARPVDTHEIAGRVGRPYPDCDVRNVDATGAPADPAMGGELWLRVPEDNRVEEFPSGAPLTDPDGWIGTGDICRQLTDGSLQFPGRRSELLNIGGNKRASCLFENLVRGLPGVAEVAAFRLPDPGGGDLLGLAVVPGPGFDAAALAAQLSVRLGARYPFRSVTVAAIPVTAACKTDRARIAPDHQLQGPDAAAPGPSLTKKEI